LALTEAERELGFILTNTKNTVWPENPQHRNATSERAYSMEDIDMTCSSAARNPSDSRLFHLSNATLYSAWV